MTNKNQMELVFGNNEKVIFNMAMYYVNEIFSKASLKIKREFVKRFTIYNLNQCNNIPEKLYTITNVKYIINNMKEDKIIDKDLTITSEINCISVVYHKKDIYYEIYKGGKESIDSYIIKESDIKKIKRYNKMKNEIKKCLDENVESVRGYTYTYPPK